MDKRHFSKNGHYALKDYEYALRKVENGSEQFELAQALIELIVDSKRNGTSAHQGLVLSVLRECVSLDAYTNGRGKDDLKVSKITIPEDLTSFFADVLPKKKPSEKGE